MAAQLTAIKGSFFLFEALWMARATTSFPVPLSPVIKIVALLSAALTATLNTSSILTECEIKQSILNFSFEKYSYINLYLSPNFSISVIADITCDIDGSIPTTHRASTILAPVYDVDRNTFQELPPFASQHSISVMAIDNLPCELPRESSAEFSRQLREWVVPELGNPKSPILEKATIARDGNLTLDFMYLSDYVSKTP
jgi:hypothetical protein